MADNGSANRLNNRRIRQARRAGNPRVDATNGGRVPPTSDADWGPPRTPPAPASSSAQAPIGPPAGQQRNGAKVEIGKVNLAPDVSLPPLTFSYSKTTVVQGASGGGAGRKATPGSGFTSDEDIRAYCEAVRKEARPKAVERALDAEVLESGLRNIPDVYGSMKGSRGRARKVSRHLKRIAAAEKLIAKQASALYASFTREYEAELAQISSGRRHGDPRQAPRRRNNAWKQW